MVTSLAIREFEQSILNYVRGSPLPSEVKRLALREICGELEIEAVHEIKIEITKRDQEEKYAE